MDFKTIELLIVGLINALCVMLAVWIYYSNHRATENKLFSIFSIFALLWIDFGYFSLHLGDKLCILLTRLNVGVVPIFFIIFYLFSLSFSGQSIRKSLINKTVVFSGMLVFITSTFTSLVVKSVVIHSWGTSLVVGSLADFYYIWIVLVLGLIIYTQTKQLRSSSGPEKSKISMFLIGFFVFAAINIIVNVLFPVLFHTNQYYKFGDYSIIIFIGLTAYAIMKHQLFNIKVIATETTVIALSIGLLVEILLSNDLTEGLLKGMVWVLATYGGYVLVKSVKTEIKQKEKLGVLARKLEQANDHLKELDETKDNFLSMAAHELNTPIAAINGYLSMLVDENLCGPINKDATKYLEQIYGSSKRLANLVKDLLNVSRIESNRIHIIYTEAQMEDVIKQSIGEVAIKAKEAGHKLSFEQPSHKLPQTWMDVPRITEVLINFLGNSIKYTEPPGKIVVRAHADDGKIVVAVEDNGRGIPKDKYNHIFEKFTQVNVLKDEVKGTGLGMFISKNLIGMHKGKIWFKSSVDQDDHGTTFYFSIPVVKNKPYDPHENEGALFALKPASKEDTEKVKAELDKELGNSGPVDRKSQVGEDKSSQIVVRSSEEQSAEDKKEESSSSKDRSEGQDTEKQKEQANSEKDSNEVDNRSSKPLDRKSQIGEEKDLQIADRSSEIVKPQSDTVADAEPQEKKAQDVRAR